MNKMLKKTILAVLLIAVLAFAVVKFADSSVKGLDFTSAMSRDNVAFKTGEASGDADANGVIHEENWQEAFPDIYASYIANEENSYVVSYLETDPGLKKVYEGFGFAKAYDSAKGHTYCLEDVINTARPHGLANCLTCKTADFTALVNKLGSEAYSMPFEETVENMTQSVGCYSCHENQAGSGELVVTHDYTARLTDINEIDADTAVCGQCHCEYYFLSAEENKAVEVPYTNTAEMDPSEILAFYDEIGFADYTNTSTGAKLIKVQHPEMETVTGIGNKHTAMGITCADCHMAVMEGEDGNLFISHKLVSPVDDSEEAAVIQANVCAECHGNTNMKAKVQDIQATVTAREKVVLDMLSEIYDKLAELTAKGVSDEKLADIRYAYRASEFMFDFCYVENSEGAHNSQMATELLAQAQAYANTALKMLEDFE